MTLSKTTGSAIEMNQTPFKIKTGQKNKMSPRRIYKNLVVVSVGYFFLFSAYQSLANLQSTLNMEANIGLVSQSLIYAALIVSSLFLPKLVIKQLGCKLTLVLGVLTYAPYVAANFYPHLGSFAPTAIVLGLGAAPLWSAKCTYINEISSVYAQQTSEPADVVTSKFFGVFFMVFQNTQIWGNLVSFLVLRPSRSDDGFTEKFDSGGSYFGQNYSATVNLSVIPSCGIGFANQSSNENLEPPPPSRRYMLIGIYLACVIVAATMVALFLDPLKRKSDATDTDGVLLKVAATLKHLRKTEQLLLVPLTIFSGIEQAFILGEFTKAYVACTWGVHSVGEVFICFGVVNAVMSFWASRVVKYVSRKAVMIVGAAGNAGVCIALFLWDPMESTIAYAFVLIGVWGLSDAIWQTQINALYGVLFRSQEEAAFGNYRLWESLGFAMSFAYSSFLNVACKIYILLGFLILGMTGYIAVEILTLRKSVYVVTKPS